MASVESSTQAALQAANTNHVEPNEVHGRQRIGYFDYTFGGTDVSVINFLLIPPGRTRVLLPLSWLDIVGTATGANMDVGYGSYTDQAGVAVAADTDAFLDNVTIASNSRAQMGDTTTAGVITEYPLINAQTRWAVLGAVIDQPPVIGDTIEGHITYVND